MRALCIYCLDTIVEKMGSIIALQSIILSILACVQHNQSKNGCVENDLILTVFLWRYKMTLTMMILFEISNNQPPLFHIPEIHLCLFSKRQKINYGVLVLISQIRSSKKKVSFLEMSSSSITCVRFLNMQVGLICWFLHFHKSHDPNQVDLFNPGWVLNTKIIRALIGPKPEERTDT